MLADNSMILGQRLGEWCGHGPVLEQDIALTNIALDLIGEARNYYQYLAEVEGNLEDDYPMKRDVRSFRNALLVEQLNGNWADTIMRQCMFDCWHYFHLEAMTQSSDERLAAIAKKSIKEAAYHLSFSGEWVIRLGDGTAISAEKIQHSLDKFMPYYEELFIPQQYELVCIKGGISPDLESVKANADSKFKEIMATAKLNVPVSYFNKKGGKAGLHSEHLGFILAEMQFLQKTYTNSEW